METIRNPTVAFVIFAILVGLLFTFYQGLEDNYDIQEDDLKDYEGDAATGEQTSIITKLKNLNLIQGVSELQEGIQKLTTPANPLDILGGLAAVGTGVLRIIGGIVLLPLEIILALTAHYQIPSPITTGIGAMFTIYIGFLILSAYLRHRV